MPGPNRHATSKRTRSKSLLVGVTHTLSLIACTGPAHSARARAATWICVLVCIVILVSSERPAAGARTYERTLAALVGEAFPAFASTPGGNLAPGPRLPARQPLSSPVLVNRFSFFPVDYSGRRERITMSSGLPSRSPPDNVEGHVRRACEPQNGPSVRRSMATPTDTWDKKSTKSGIDDARQIMYDGRHEYSEDFARIGVSV